MGFCPFQPDFRTVFNPPQSSGLAAVARDALGAHPQWLGPHTDWAIEHKEEEMTNQHEKDVVRARVPGSDIHLH